MYKTQDRLVGGGADQHYREGYSKNDRIFGNGSDSRCYGGIIVKLLYCESAAIWAVRGIGAQQPHVCLSNHHHRL